MEKAAIPLNGAKSIAETFFQRIQRCLICINGNAALHDAVDFAQFVNSVRVIGVFMRVKHGIQRIDGRRQKLFAQIRAGINQNVFRAVLNQQRSA